MATIDFVVFPACYSSYLLLYCILFVEVGGVHLTGHGGKLSTVFFVVVGYNTTVLVVLYVVSWLNVRTCVQ